MAKVKELFPAKESPAPPRLTPREKFLARLAGFRASRIGSGGCVSNDVENELERRHMAPTRGGAPWGQRMNDNDLAPYVKKALLFAQINHGLTEAAWSDHIETCRQAEHDFMAKHNTAWSQERYIFRLRREPEKALFVDRPSMGRLAVEP